ncbi:protein ALP1-like isoform X1 [Aphis craccivora]|uniref:Protein ALP1-like isoform X1 n=1 Tax=Aphis craccivora TaxID=307492 RepID=A0A6G0W0U5_APHCR|nr:protein ALP1-like isoform X1 [Aphis craccivora]
MICAYYLRKQLRQNKKRRRRYHNHLVIVDRPIEGEFCTLFSKLREHESKFFDYFRMSIKSFDELLAKLEDSLKRQNTFRIPVSPAERLSVTIR